MSSLSDARELKPPPRARWIGIDLVRLMSFVAITFHHFTWVIWYGEDYRDINWHLGWHLFEIYARALSFSGHSILFLSSFLIGRAESHWLKTWKIIAFVAAGWIAFCLFEKGENPVFWTWDIYPLIVVGLASAALLRRVSLRLLLVLGVVGFLMTWIPFWDWEVFKPISLQWRHWLIGDCTVDLADWPLLPWVGFIWAPYALGAWVRDREDRGLSIKLDVWHRFEWILWPFLFAIAIPNLGAFYHIVVGDRFACFSFRQPPLVFWSHLLFIIFLLRISILPRTQTHLLKSPLAVWIAGLKISRSFGLAYLVHYTLIEGCRYGFGAFLRANVSITFLVFLMIIPVTEILVRVLEDGWKRFSSRRRDESSRPPV